MDLIDRQFGRLTVIAFNGVHESPCGTKRKMWKCKCECGNEVVVNTSNLLSGTTKSCGCLKHEKLMEHNTSHGGTNDRLYGIWKAMKRRCNSPHDSHYGNYGGKGISVCKEWADSYAAFRKWAYENGYDESAPTGECTIDRIDNDGDYEPSNCRWVNRIAQANNTSQNRHVTLNGKRLTIAEFARIMGISKFKARYRIELFEKGVETDGQQFDLEAGGDRCGASHHL